MLGLRARSFPSGFPVGGSLFQRFEFAEGFLQGPAGPHFRFLEHLLGLGPGFAQQGVGVGLGLAQVEFCRPVGLLDEVGTRFFGRFQGFVQGTFHFAQFPDFPFRYVELDAVFLVFVHYPFPFLRQSLEKSLYLFFIVASQHAAECLLAYLNRGDFMLG
jgi:hypothetical protein